MLFHVRAGGQSNPSHLHVLLAYSELEIIFVWVGSLEISVASELIPSIRDGVGAVIVILSINIWLSVERGP